MAPQTSLKFDRHLHKTKLNDEGRSFQLFRQVPERTSPWLEPVSMKQRLQRVGSSRSRERQISGASYCRRRDVGLSIEARLDFRADRLHVRPALKIGSQEAHDFAHVLHGRGPGRIDGARD